MNQIKTPIINVEDLIKDIARQFYEADISFFHGTDNAVDESAYLVFGYLGLDHDSTEITYQKNISKSDIAALELLCKKRIDSKLPVAYILNQAWFAGLEFFVDQRVLIPRSPIAELILNQFKPWIDLDFERRALDLGTGSGCIAIALATYFSKISVDAIDYSIDALEVAKINIKKHSLENRVRLIESNFFESLSATKNLHQYDLIVSNPPYVNKEDISIMPMEFRHEPIIGLASGDDGLESVNIILRDAGDYLRKNGILIVEVGNSQWALQEQYPKLPFVWLDFEMGGAGVFLLTKEDLDNHNKH
jgi:ribosomal protein L3 glutamine methyltransferase|tara:strand:+ start:353 stop:1267 length:915 start_codon:yes stop_codon:yes gene_type:complete